MSGSEVRVPDPTERLVERMTRAAREWSPVVRHDDRWGIVLIVLMAALLGLLYASPFIWGTK